MHVTLKPLIDRFFKDKTGKWAIIQFPNTLLFAWIILTIALFVVHDDAIAEGVRLLQSSVLFAWAYDEAATGSSYFRKVLGVVFIVVVILGYFLT